VKFEPEIEIDDAPVEKPPQVKQSKGNKCKGKQTISYPNRPKTRATNKLRLNSKALFKLSLKQDNLIILDDDIIEEIHKKTRKLKKKYQLVPKIESSPSDDKTPGITKKERIAIHTLRQMSEMTYFYMEKEHLVYLSLQQNTLLRKNL
jgi:hypothetical protein